MTIRALRVALLAPLILVSLLTQPAVAAPGFHAAWVDQSPWPTLRPGSTESYTIHFRNTGDTTWNRGTPLRQVNLAVGGDSTALADAGMAVGWLSANRVATTSEISVAPNAIATFTFTLRAPSTPGTYRLPLHPVLEGVQHLEDEGVFVLVVSDPGFHSAWVSQSPYPTLQPGQVSTALSIVFRNTGTQTWTKGVLGLEARLGINQDDAQWAPLGVNWMSVNRVAAQTEPSVPQLANVFPVPNINASGESGLMSIELDPAFATNNLLYVCVSVNDGGLWLNQVQRFRMNGNTPVFDRYVIRSGMRANGNHDGCRIRFGPDGKLWVTMGDAGDTANGQNPNVLNGKVLRVNADGSIPADNPIMPGASGRTRSEERRVGEG